MCAGLWFSVDVSVRCDVCLCVQVCGSVWMSVYDVMCICVCRFVVQFGRVLQRQELDAFLAMAVSPLLHDVQTMQDLKVRLLAGPVAGLSSLVLNEITGITDYVQHTHTCMLVA